MTILIIAVLDLLCLFVNLIHVIMECWFEDIWFLNLQGDLKLPARSLLVFCIYFWKWKFFRLPPGILLYRANYLVVVLIWSYLIFSSIVINIRRVHGWRTVILRCWRFKLCPELLWATRGQQDTIGSTCVLHRLGCISAPPSLLPHGVHVIKITPVW